jgi:hypothetical protein
MFSVSDIQPHIEHEFGSRLEPLGFLRLGRRKWVRSEKLPIRELFVIGALKGGQYSASWGFSCGFAPFLRGQTFRPQNTDKNAIMDLRIDPIDVSGKVPPQAFGFITDCDRGIPIQEIRTSAEHFIPLALADFGRVHSVNDFCQFFMERKRLQYHRFGFDMYVQHRLVHGFVLILTGRRDEGVKRIQDFCEIRDADFNDSVLSECISYAESHQTTT